MSKIKLLKQGRYLGLFCQNNWEFVSRVNCNGIVIVLALTQEKRVLFVEQYRIPVRKRVIEFPAGLMNDQGLKRKESFVTAAKRELLEETGYAAQKITKVVEGPTSGGSSRDLVTIVRAEGLKKVHAGGGDATESIRVHEVLLSQADRWLASQMKKGLLVDPKVYAGLYFLKTRYTPPFFR